MTEIAIQQRKAVLHRQAADGLRREAAESDMKALAYDGTLSDYEVEELALRLKALLYFVQYMTAEAKLATLAIQGAGR